MKGRVFKRIETAISFITRNDKEAELDIDKIKNFYNKEKVKCFIVAYHIDNKKFIADKIITADDYKAFSIDIVKGTFVLETE